MHSTQVRSRRCQLARFATGGKQQGVVSECRSVIEAESLVGSCNFLDTAAEVGFHGVLRVELRGSYHQPIALQRAGEILFREWWTLIG
jgi:hypothetical protein